MVYVVGLHADVVCGDAAVQASQTQQQADTHNVLRRTQFPWLLSVDV